MFISFPGLQSKDLNKRKALRSVENIDNNNDNEVPVKRMNNPNVPEYVKMFDEGRWDDLNNHLGLNLNVVKPVESGSDCNQDTQIEKMKTPCKELTDVKTNSPSPSIERDISPNSCESALYELSESGELIPYQPNELLQLRWTPENHKNLLVGYILLNL